MSISLSDHCNAVYTMSFTVDGFPWLWLSPYIIMWTLSVSLFATYRWLCSNHHDKYCLVNVTKRACFLSLILFAVMFRLLPVCNQTKSNKWVSISTNRWERVYCKTRIINAHTNTAILCHQILPFEGTMAEHNSAFKPTNYRHNANKSHFLQQLG